MFFFARNNPEQAQVQVTQIPPTPVPATFTPTATDTATPTETSTPTSTNTPVLGNGAEGTEEAPVDTPTVDPNATATNTAVLQTPTLTATLEPTATPTSPPEAIPESGGVLSVARHSFLGWVGAGLLLMLIIFGVFNRFKLLSQDSQK